MDDLIKALLIFRKYTNSTRPTHCEHDELFIVDILKEDVSDEDIETLDKLSFAWRDENNCFSSYRFGSA